MTSIGINIFDVQIPSEIVKTGNIKKRVFTNDDFMQALFRAGKTVLDVAHIKPKEIGLVLFGGGGAPERWMWSFSAKLQYLLGLSNAFAYDIFNGCNSLQICLQIAHQYLSLEKEQKYVLILIGDKLSSLGENTHVAYAPLWSFGDSASAVLIQKDCHQLQLVAQSFQTDGEFADDLWREQKSGQTFLEDDLEHNYALAKVYEKNYVRQIQKVIDKISMPIDKIKAICMNQGSPKIIQNIEKLMGFLPGTIIKTYADYGHLGSSDILIGLKHLLHKKTNLNVLPGEYILLASSSVGYSWGCSVIRV